MTNILGELQLELFVLNSFFDYLKNMKALRKNLE